MTALDVSVESGVPMRILGLSHLDEQRLTLLAPQVAGVVGSAGDDLQFGGRRTADAWASLITGLAAPALLGLDGVTWRGHHWCTRPHPDCPTTTSQTS